MEIIWDAPHGQGKPTTVDVPHHDAGVMPMVRGEFHYKYVDTTELIEEILTISAYVPELFRILGTTGRSEQLLRTAILGAEKLIASLCCTVLLVDYIGRKRSLAIRIVIQLLAMLYVAIYLTVPQHSSAPYRVSFTAVICLCLVGVGWALGWNVVQYLINDEILPLPVRVVGSGTLMCFHYANRYGLTKVPIPFSPTLAEVSLADLLTCFLGCSVYVTRNLSATVRNILVFQRHDLAWVGVGGNTTTGNGTEKPGGE